MKRDINTTGSAARALSARNPVAFECVGSLEESVGRLAAITDPPRRFEMFRRAPSFREQLDTPMAPVAKRPSGSVDANAVRLDWETVRFEGHWAASLDRVKLEGTMVPRGVGSTVIPYFGFLSLAVAMMLVNRAYWALGIVGLLVVVAMPLLVGALGSARVAAEIELERIIGSAIGDPEKYAVRWNRWKDD